MKTNCILYLVRHGQTEWNVRKLIQGHRDIPLNEKGKEQARKLADELKAIKFDAIYSSDLKRASETAGLIASTKGLDVHISEDLRERDFGKFAGQSFEGNRNLAKFIDDLEKKSGNKEIESDEKLMNRFVGYLKKITLDNFGKIILVVSHAGPMRTFLIELGWGTYENLNEGCISNLAYIKLQSNGEKFIVRETFGIIKTL
ncbi:histidine phosphatase family protein [Candidatus Roizmanbacteria bacterium]|nr:histidine phosphatase family protein [Candidatus Roizmanbacteria bacterium]